MSNEKDISVGTGDLEPEETMESIQAPKEVSTYEERSKANGMVYTVTDVPPLPTAILLGVQHYLTMLGASVLVPLILTPAMGATQEQTAQVIATAFFVAGINTLIQTTIGDRLPIVQSGSFAYLPATFTIIFHESLQSIENDNDRFHETMRVIQGAIIVVGLVQMAIGYTGIIVPMLRYISPVTIAPVVAAIGLGLYNVGFNNVSNCFAIGLLQIGLTILFSQYLKNIKIGGYAIFALFPIVLAISLTWSFGAILTAADVWEEGHLCRTDAARDLLKSTPWFRIPYPGQWGAPRFESYAIVPMLGSMAAGMIESIGDYYSCARLSGAPPPTAGIVSRGLAGEGIGIVLAGLFGTGNGTTSYSENIGAMNLTRVGSRAVIQCGAVVMILVGVISKVSGLLASMPSALVGGIYCCVFGLIVAVGLSTLQYVDLNSERNLFIIGFALFNSLSVAGPGGYFSTQEENPFGDSNGAQIALAIFSSPMIIALLSAFILDNTVPSKSREERGLHVWDAVRNTDTVNDPEYIKVYSLPLGLSRIFRNCVYLEYPSIGRIPPPPEGGYRSGRGDIGELCCWFLPGCRGAEDNEDEAINDVTVDKGEDPEVCDATGENGNEMSETTA
ncbi:Nucleobase-ascorbate transporter [Seminavis robusta]|uniref:Nucleobase-ascorbate transporter n=1 Tax=Seminavis robusta TaxID=568900 RepID=A0A9N8F1Y3_9STRA|nr:Nucleobase-ascorbate transporter [Seminavis robusta]|eukprot:Sro2889_g339500.1 Nucleobase-ascorbate transporter (617) ;mRNA; r:2218-4328